MRRVLCNRWRPDVMGLRPKPRRSPPHHSASAPHLSSKSGGANGTNGGDGSGQEDSQNRPPPPLVFLDVPYFEGEGACDEKHRLDVYIPSAPFPRPRSRTCLFVHGGSWQRGDRRHPTVPDHFYGNVGRAFAAKGLVGLVMSYRLAPGVQHPEQVRDIARAVRWAHDNVSRYGGDGNDIVLVGHSAGAHLAALCLADGRWLEEEGIGAGIACTRNSCSSGGANESRATSAAAGAVGSGVGVGVAARGVPSQSSPASASSSSPPPTPGHVVSGFVGISGVYDIPRMAGNFVGGVIARTAFGTDRRVWKRASPLHCVRAATAQGIGDVGGVCGDSGDSGVEDDGLLTPGSTPADADLMRRSGGDGHSEQLVTTLASTTTTTATATATAKPTASSTAAAETAVAKAGTANAAAEKEWVFPVDNGDGVARRVCPLLHTEVLLLTAASDFHLEEDAEALVEALNLGYRLGRRSCGHHNETRATGVDNCSGNVAEGRVGDRFIGGESGESERWRRRERALDGVGGGSLSRSDEDGDSRRRYCSGRGGARHERIDGEDHLSVIVSFGESDTKASNAVLEFILGLPPRRRRLL